MSSRITWEVGNILRITMNGGLLWGSDYLSCLDIIILWHIDPLLGSGPRTTMELLLFPVVRLEAISRYRSSSISAVERSGASWLVSEWVRGRLRFSPYEPLLWEAGSWGTGIVRLPRVRGTSSVESHYQAPAAEDTADGIDFVSACCSEL
jgi:hypothetical protein